MARYLILLLAVSFASGCEYKPVRTTAKKVNQVRKQLQCWPTQPVGDLPAEMRQRNSRGRCMHCGWVTALNQVHQYKLANDWWGTCWSHGADFGQMMNKADREGIRYAYCGNGDITFIERAVASRRFCLMSDMGGHARAIVGLDPAWKPGAKAYVQDNHGNPYELDVYPRDTWINMWRRHGGDAMCPIYDPIPVVTHN